MRDKISSFQLSLPDAELLFDLAQQAGQSGWSLKQWQEELSHPQSHIWGVNDSATSSLIGFLAVRYDAAEFWIMNLAVAPSYRRSGIAAQLMSELVERADMSQANIWLEVRSGNQAAIQLYAQFGFEVSSIRKGYYAAREGLSKEDATLMCRSFNL
jgi:[ribosomal protein S18]-alanine N-acetyltransferase